MTYDMRQIPDYKSTNIWKVNGPVFISFTGLSSLKINWHWQCWLWVIIIRAQDKNRFYTQNYVETKLKKDACYF